MTDEQMLATLALWGWRHHGRTFMKALHPGSIAVVSVRDSEVTEYPDIYMSFDAAPSPLWEPINVFYRIVEMYEKGRIEARKPYGID